jgi:PPP family 3-phenylpropionic acid transporter
MRSQTTDMESTSQGRTPSFWLLLSINACYYMTTALYGPFLVVYYEQHGVSSTLIGILSTIGCLAMILVQPLWSKLSDRCGRARTFAALMALGSAATLQFYYLGTGIAAFIFAAAALAIFQSSVAPMIDAICVRGAAAQGRNFASIRIGGTIGYSLVVLVAALIMNRHPSLQFAFGGVGYLILSGLILLLPSGEDHQPVPRNKKKSLFTRLSLREIFDTDEVIYVLIFAFLMQLGNSFAMSFLGVFVVQIGGGNLQMGMLNFISALAEIPVLLSIRRFMRPGNALRFIGTAAALLGLKVVIMSTGTMPAMVIAMLFQGITYMVIHIGAATYVSAHALPGRASEAQGLIYLVQGGFASIIGNVCGGILIDAAGIHTAYLLTGSIVLLGAALTASTMKLRYRSA